MAFDTAGVDRALGAIGTTFRLTRLYPPSHPAVAEALRQIAETLPTLAALGTVEWKVGVTGLHWQGQHLLPRNTQIAELAGLLYARGVRAVTLNPGMIPDQVLALFRVALGSIPPDDATLGRVTLSLGRRSAVPLERLRTPTPVHGVPAVPDATPPAARAPPPVASVPEAAAAKRSSHVFQPDVLPPDVEAHRAIGVLKAAATPEEQRAAVQTLNALAPGLLERRDVTTVAEAIATLDRLLPNATDAALVEAIDQVAVALSDRALVERMVQRLGESRVPPEEREALVAAVGALAGLSLTLVLDAFVGTPLDRRGPPPPGGRRGAGRAGSRRGGGPGVVHGVDPPAGPGARRRGTGGVVAGHRPPWRQGGARGARPARRAGGEGESTQPDGARGGGGGAAPHRTPRGAGPLGTLQQGQGAGGAQSGGGGAEMTTRAVKSSDAALAQTMTREVAKRVVGQELMVERLLVGVLTGGHILLEGVPGLAKTLAVRTVAECLHISFSRIQFTPDLLPADVIGTMVYDQRSQEFYPKKGPLFANLVLADEINRAPAKVQSALLEAMQEKQVTIGGETFFLGEPFLVLATQNPIEHEGTYPLPEAQLDRDRK